MTGHEDDADYQRALERRKAWVTDEEIQGLNLERATGIKVSNGPETHLEQARRLLREAAPMAAQSLIRLAQNSDSDTVRLRAAIEILNRSEQVGAGSDGREPWMEVYEQTLTPAAIDELVADALRHKEQLQQRPRPMLGPPKE